MGLDWGRLMPFEPGSLNCRPDGKILSTSTGGDDVLFKTNMSACGYGIQDTLALKRYLQIFGKVRSQNMRIMLTLFHHSPPKWALVQSFGGWTNSKLTAYFTF